MLGIGRCAPHDPGRYRHARVTDVDARADEQDWRAIHELGDVSVSAAAEGTEQVPEHRTLHRESTPPAARSSYLATRLPGSADSGRHAREVRGVVRAAAAVPLRDLAPWTKGSRPIDDAFR